MVGGPGCRVGGAGIVAAVGWIRSLAWGLPYAWVRPLKKMWRLLGGCGVQPQAVGGGSWGRL